MTRELTSTSGFFKSPLAVDAGLNSPYVRSREGCRKQKLMMVLFKAAGAEVLSDVGGAGEGRRVGGVSEGFALLGNTRQSQNQGRGAGWIL